MIGREIALLGERGVFSWSGIYSINRIWQRFKGNFAHLSIKLFDQQFKGRAMEWSAAAKCSPSIVGPIFNQRRLYHNQNVLNNSLKAGEVLPNTKMSKHASKENSENQSRKRLKTLQEERKSIINDLRLTRASKKHARQLKYIESRRELAKSYKEYTTNVAEVLHSKESVASLFEMETDRNSALESLKNQEPHNRLEIAAALGVDSLSYTDVEIQSTIMLLVTLLVNSVLVELNVRNMLYDENLIDHNNSFIFRNALFENIKDSKKKNEILKSLVTNFYSRESGTPSSLEDFFKFLNKSDLKKLFEESIKQSDSFNSLEVYRYYYHYFKTSQYLNYDNSDTQRNVRSWQPLRFNSPEISNSEYAERFENIFANYDRYSVSGHLNLALEVANTLLTCKKYTPDSKVFKYLIDTLGELELYNYQSLVYDCLPSVKHMSTALATPADGIKPLLFDFNFEHLIICDSGFLKSLIKYQIQRHDRATLKELLSFYRLDEVQVNESVLEHSKLSVLLSRSRFSRNKDLGLKQNGFKRFSVPIYVPPDSVYTAIEASILLKQFDFIDPLFNKLLTHSVEIDGKVMVALSGDDIKPGDNLVSHASSITEIANKIFTKDLFKLLLFASRESDDVGRLMWILPHLDRYIESNLEDSKEYISDLKTRISFLQDKKETKIVITEKDTNSAIDAALIAEIYETLNVLRLDGKLNQYNTLFDFAKTSARLYNIEFTREALAKVPLVE